jgi:hypothetical protein
MGGAQPLAATMAGASMLAVDCDRTRIEKRLATKYLDVMALAEIGNISERRTALLVDRSFSLLPAFLATNPGVESGYMIAQVTAATRGIAFRQPLRTSPVLERAICRRKSRASQISYSPEP